MLMIWLENPSILNKYDESALMVFNKTAKSSDEIIELLTKHGDDAVPLYLQYGDSIIEPILKYGDSAVDGIRKYGHDYLMLYNSYVGEFAENYFNYGKVTIGIYLQYDELAADILNEGIEAKKVAFKSEIGNIRNELPTTDTSKRGNMAVADIHISGVDNKFIAHSQINNPTDAGADVANFSFLKNELDRFFTSYIDDRYPRYHDTEAKILEDVATQISDSNISGKIDLYTERPCCKSCTRIVLEFREKFPKIQLNIYAK